MTKSCPKNFWYMQFALFRPISRVQTTTVLCGKFPVKQVQILRSCASHPCGPSCCQTHPSPFLFRDGKAANAATQSLGFVSPSSVSVPTSCSPALPIHPVRARRARALGRSRWPRDAARSSRSSSSATAGRCFGSFALAFAFFLSFS